MKTLLFQESRFLLLNLTLFFLILLFFNFKKRYVAYYVIILLSLIYFYRDPKINVTYSKDYIYAMSYGTVVEIQETKNNYIISCFLSPKDVHIQYVPYSSKVLNIKYYSGSNYPAFILKSSKNEHLDTLLEFKFKNNKIKTKIKVRQIGGILVRRIVSFLKVNDQVKTGQKLGMIKFGSRVEITLSKKNIELLIKKGDYLVGGFTKIAKFIF